MSANRDKKRKELEAHRAKFRGRRPGIDTRIVEKISISDEIEYIMRRAENGEGRCVSLSKLVFFSTESGDAWMLDPEDSFALRLMKGGERQPFNVTETDNQFAIEWDKNYAIEGDLFHTVEKKSGRKLTIMGYPIREIQEAIERMRQVEN